MSRVFSAFFGGRLQTVLITSFVFVAIVTGVLNTVVIARVINDYLTYAQTDRVSRDMDIAYGLFQEKLTEVAAASQWIATDPQTTLNFAPVLSGDPIARGVVSEVISRKFTASGSGNSEVILVLDDRGNILVGRVLSADGRLSGTITHGNWGSLPIVADALVSTQPMTGTEVIPSSYLAQVSLDDQAHVALRQTDQAARDPFDAREGTAGLALVSIYPLGRSASGVGGAVVTAYLLNNDASFVDYLRNVAKIETATIFLGDLRVTTNVVDSTGTRAVGTRVSQTVYDAVLRRGQPYFGRVFVVTDWYLGKYQPLRDHAKHVIGMLYVGARESTFRHLVDAFTSRAVIIALICIFVAGILALPISHWISGPISDLVAATHRLAQGDMDVRVESYGRGEFARLSQSFNSMVETLSDTQEELLRKDKLASMGQLAAGVAHELNNPLGTILLYADAMTADAPENDPRREDLKMIVGEAQRCKVIVANLLNFARQHEVAPEIVDLNQLLQDLVSKVRIQARFEQVEFCLKLDPGLPAIQADPAQLQQVFINLLNNSADAISGPGTVTITTRSLDRHSVQVLVADTGSGIPPEAVGKLFTPFFTTKPAGKGTGLGLAIVYGIVKMHRGQIHVESHLGHGATMIVELPVRSSDHPVHNSSSTGDLIL